MPDEEYESWEYPFDWVEDHALWVAACREVAELLGEHWPEGYRPVRLVGRMARTSWPVKVSLN